MCCSPVLGEQCHGGSLLPVFYGVGYIIDMKEFLKKAGRGKDGAKDLSSEEAQSALSDIIYGRATDVQIGAFYAVMRMKGETTEELGGFLKVARLTCKTIDLNSYKDFDNVKNLIDVSTTYDGKLRSPHILPSAVFIASASGANIVTHGSVKVPTKEADSFFDVLIKMGCTYSGTAKKIKETLLGTGFCYYHQSVYSPKLYSLLPLRREYGLRTFLNVIEKSLNLLNVDRTLASVYHEPYFELQSKLAEEAGFKNWFIVKGIEGGVEPMVANVSKVVVGSKVGKEEVINLDPKELGIDIDKTKLTPMTSHEAGAMNKKVLEGSGEAMYRDMAIYSAALIVFASGVSSSMEDAINKCEEGLTSGEALNRFKDYKKITSSFD